MAQTMMNVGRTLRVLRVSVQKMKQMRMMVVVLW